MEEVTTVIPGRAWVVPQLLSEEECSHLLQLGEDFGLDPPSAAGDGQKKPGENRKREVNMWPNWNTDTPRLHRCSSGAELSSLEAEWSPAGGVTGLRTSKRTANYCNPDVASLLANRLPDVLLESLELTKPHT